MCHIWGVPLSGHMVELVIGVDSKSILFKNQFSNFENVKKQELKKSRNYYLEKMLDSICKYILALGGLTVSALLWFTNRSSVSLLFVDRDL